MSGRRRLPLRCLAVVGLVAIPTVGFGFPGLSRAGADGYAGTFTASATADGVRLTVVDPNAPLTQTAVDGGGPSAQAYVDSTNESRAYASFPFPGETAVSAPGLLRGAGGIPAPDYPLYVGSYHPSVPEAELGDGPYHLEAKSTAESSSGSATAGMASEAASVSQATSTASARSAADGVAAEAMNRVTSFALGPLRLAEVVSTAKADLDGTGNLTREASTKVLGATVGDTPVELEAGDLSAASALLAPAGITVEFTPQQEFDTGVAAPALRVSRQDPANPASSVTYLLASASAFVDGVPANDGIDTVTPEPEPGDTTPDTDTDSDTKAASAPAEARTPVVERSVGVPFGSTDVAPHRAAPSKVTGTRSPVAEGTAPAAVTAPSTVLAHERFDEPEELVAAGPGADRATTPRSTRIVTSLVSTSDSRPLVLLFTAGCIGAALIAGLVPRARKEGSR